MDDLKTEMQNVERYIKLQRQFEEIAKYCENKGFSPLTEKELIVLKDVALGMSNLEISEKNNIGKSTVASHRKHINDKLGTSRVQLITLYAIECGYLTDVSIKSIN